MRISAHSSSVPSNCSAIELDPIRKERIENGTCATVIKDTATILQPHKTKTAKKPNKVTLNAKLVHQNESPASKTTPRIIMTLLTLFLNILCFADGYYVFENAEYIKDLLKATLSVMGIHLVLGHLLANVIYSLEPNDMILYSTTACIRDIINNIVMTLIYIFDDYGYWWKPIMWGCYIADLVMLLSKWKYFKSNWRRFVFAHHFGVGIMILVLNHTTKLLTDAALLSIVTFMNSNSPGCASPIWKAFKLPFYKQSTVICFVLQRIVRFAAFGLCSRVASKHFFEKDYCYVVLVVFAATLDIWDIYSQVTSIYKYYKKQLKQTAQMLQSDL